MSELLIRPLPYCSDSSLLFSHLESMSGAVFLDSGGTADRSGRFDILAASPNKILFGWGRQAIVKDSTTKRTEIYEYDSPMEAVRRAIAAKFPNPLWNKDHNLPFIGGAIGYFSYDFAARLEGFPKWLHEPDCIRCQKGQGLPDFWLGIYPWTVVIDHHLQTGFMAAKLDGEFSIQDFQKVYDLIRKLTDKKPMKTRMICHNPARAAMSREHYAACFRKIKRHIRRGECYQVNFSQRFDVEIRGSIWQAYTQLRSINSSPYSAYLNIGSYQIASISPELFLQVKGSSVTTKPIKGTSVRKASRVEDEKSLNALRHSVKDKAENLMIVDLLRNDLSKSCQAGTVKTSELFGVKSLANVHHLVSVITGVLDEGLDALDLLVGCFPGGSISGAPKRKAMEIIAQLEPCNRGVYCGSIGYISYCGCMEMNIAIRTLAHCRGQVSFHGGGGIVHDSRADQEYQETLDKISTFIQVFS